MGEWHPLVHADKLCGHVTFSRRDEGWNVDCDESAVFVRTTENGGHEFSCAVHVGDFPSADT